MPKSSRKSVCNIFYGYQVEEIMRVCAVSKATAQHFKRGSRLPSPQAQRLWWLYMQGRILPSGWTRVRAFRDTLIDEAGNAYREGEIAAIPWLKQQIADLSHQVDRLQQMEGMRAIDVGQLAGSLRETLGIGQHLLELVERIPLRSARPSREAENGINSKTVGLEGTGTSLGN